MVLLGHGFTWRKERGRMVSFELEFNVSCRLAEV